METRPGDPKHGDVARGWETLPRDERLGWFADGEGTESHDERPASDGRMYQLIRRTTGFASAPSRSHSLSPTPRPTRSRSASQQTATDRPEQIRDNAKPVRSRERGSS